MISPTIRNMVWQNLLDAARHSRYYQSLETKFRRYHFGIRFLLLLSAMVGIAPLVSSSPECISMLGSAGIAILVALDFMMDCPTKISILHLISTQCGSIEGKFQELWAECDLPDAQDQDIQQECKRLAKRSEETTSKAGAANIRVYEKLNLKSAIEAYQVIRERYEPATK